MWLFIYSLLIKNERKFKRIQLNIILTCVCGYLTCYSSDSILLIIKHSQAKENSMQKNI